MLSKWNKISLYMYQQIDAVNAKPIEEIDKTLFSMCAVFGYTEYELDNLPVKKVSRLSNKMTSIFTAPFKPKPFKRIGRYFINYDISKVSLGQYIELSFFLSNNPLHNAQYVLASVSNLPLFKNNSSRHREKAEYFLRQSVLKIMGGLSLIVERFLAFNKEYSSLFGLDTEVSGDVQEDKFNKRYGWIYSASQVAEYERITLDQAMRLPVRQAFNDLAYLKAKAKYEAEQLKRK